MRELWSKWKRRTRRSESGDAQDDLAAEIQSHLDLLTDENIERGMPPDEARAAACRHFGNPAAVRENAREAWTFPSFDSLVQDLRYGARGIRNSPGFALVIIATLALVIGANTAIFSVFDAVLLRPLPYPNADRLVSLGEASAHASGISVTWVNFQHWRSENRTFSDLAGFQTTDMAMTGRGDALLTHGGVVTHNFFALTGARPALGRLFGAEDDRSGAPATVVLGHQFWTNALGANPAVVGQTLTLNGKLYQIAGVLQAGPDFFSRPVDYYVPLGPIMATSLSRGDHRSMTVLGLLRPGVALADAQKDLDGIMRRLALSDPGPESDHHPAAESLAESRTGDIRPTMFLLLGAVSFLLFIACANVAGLLLVRGSARSREIAVRTAIGAGRFRIARQLMTENLLLSAIGGALGVLLAALGLKALVLIGPRNIPRLAEAGLDGGVLAFAAAITIAAALVAGLAPVLIANRVDLATVLKEGSNGSGLSARGHALRNGLIVGEIALTLVLAFSSGLLLRSLIQAQTKGPGFDPSRVLALELQLAGPAGNQPEQVRQFYQRLSDALKLQPGVQSVGAVNCPPAAGDCGDWWYSINGKPAPARGNEPLTLTNTADSGYFQTLRRPIIAGRDFSEADRAGAAPVAIVNREFARQTWPDPQLAIGAQIKMGGPYRPGPVYQIVGVTGDVSQMGLDAAPVPEVFVPFSQQPSAAMVVLIRTAQDPLSFAPVARRVVAGIDRDLPVQSMRSMDDWLGASLRRRRFSTLLLTLFASLAMVLAAVGIFGVLKYWVGVRQKEIAVRLALGARPAVILRWVGWHAAKLVGLGVALGAFASWLAAEWLSSLVFELTPRDPGVLLGAVAAVVGIATVAASVPLWLATRVDAVRNLHDA